MLGRIESRINILDPKIFSPKLPMAFLLKAPTSNFKGNIRLAQGRSNNPQVINICEQAKAWEVALSNEGYTYSTALHKNKINPDVAKERADNNSIKPLSKVADTATGAIIFGTLYSALGGYVGSLFRKGPKGTIAGGILGAVIGSLGTYINTK